MNRTYEYIEKPKRPKRRSFEDNQQLAQPKPGMRIRDNKVLEWARSRGVCELCKLPKETVGHHASSKGAGGSDSIGNILAVCTECHHKIHAGEISRDEVKRRLLSETRFDE